MKSIRLILSLLQKGLVLQHLIAELIKACSEIDAGFKNLFDIGAVELTDYAVEVRYVEEYYFPTIEETKEAIEIAEKVKEFVLKKLKERGFNCASKKERSLLSVQGL